MNGATNMSHRGHADLSGCSTGSATSVDAELDDCTSYVTGHFGQAAIWDEHGYYEIALDAGSLTLSP